MKKVLFAFICVTVLLGVFFSVKYFNRKQKETEISGLAIPQSFSAQIKLQYDGTDYLCNLEKDDQEIIATLEEPERLNGITLNISREEYSLNYKGMKINGEALPEKIGTAVGLVFNVLEKLENMEYTALEENNELVTANYSLGNAQFTCVYDKTTGIPKEITVSELLKIEFLQFSVG